jgi:uncharacterized protein YbcC (UPF0753/DUF2309 family)
MINLFKKIRFFMKKILLSLILLSGLAHSTDLTKEMIKQNKEIVSLASKEISKTLPQEVDKYTKLVRVDGKDTILTYVFEINTGSKSDETVKNEDHDRMEKAVTKGICKSSKNFLDANINITYLYISATSKTDLFKFDITKQTCLDIKK